MSSANKNMGIAITLFGLFASSSAASQTTANIGDCNITYQNVEGVGDTYLDCNPPRPEDAFRVRYIWMDQNSTSFALSGIYSDAITSLIGTSPIIADNVVYKELEQIWNRFGTRVQIDENNYISFPNGTYFTDSVFSKTGEEKSEIVLVEGSEPIGRLSDVRMYAAKEDILWPALDELKEQQYSRNFPKGMKLTYGPHSEYSATSYAVQNAIGNLYSYRQNQPRAFESLAVQCALSYSFLTRDEYKSYWSNLSILYEEFQKSPEFKDFVTTVDSELAWNNPAPGPNHTLQSIRYYTQKNWPKDFLLKYFIYQANDGCYQFPSVRVVPRRLFVKFAVVQAKNDKFDLRSYRYEEEESTQIRRIDDTEFSIGASNFNLGEMERRKGQSVLIPLSIELRYDMNEFPAAFIGPNDTSDEIYEIISGSNLDEFRLNQYGDKSITKSFTAFTKPTYTSLTQTYRYGPSINVVQIKVGDSSVAVRSAPAVASVVRGGFEEGSCPFVYFRDSAGVTTKYGRAIIGAVGPENSQEQVIEIPDGTVEIVISEEEPEITRLDHVEILSSEGAVIWGNEAPVVLEPGLSLTFNIPETAQASRDLSLRIKGFYKPITQQSVAAN